LKAENVIEEAGETVKIRQMTVKINLEEENSDEEKLKVVRLKII